MNVKNTEICKSDWLINIFFGFTEALYLLPGPLETTLRHPSPLHILTAECGKRLHLLSHSYTVLLTIAAA
jgi:hypothetical protein